MLARRRLPAVLLAAIAAALAWAPVAQGERHVVVASEGRTSAQLSFEMGRGAFGAENVRLRIDRDGATVLDEPVAGPPTDIPSTSPFPPGDDGIDGLFVRDLDADGEPEVLVDLLSGGANCCLYSTLFDFDPERRVYRQSQKVMGSSYRLTDLGGDGRLEIVTNDYRWKYLFACNACQRVPPRVFGAEDGRLADQTRRFRALVRRDARYQLRIVRQRSAISFRGALASLTADRCLLGRCAAALRTVRRMSRLGLLDKRGRYDYPPWGDAYVRKLSRVLERFGYR